MISEKNYNEFLKNNYSHLTLNVACFYIHSYNIYIFYNYYIHWVFDELQLLEVLNFIIFYFFFFFLIFKKIYFYRIFFLYK